MSADGVSCSFGQSCLFTVGGGVLQGGDRPAAACLILRYVNVTTSGCLNYLLREARHGETKEKIG